VSLADQKQQLRLRMRLQRAAVSALQRDEARAAVVARLIDLPEFVSARRVGIYAALPGEIGLDSLLARARERIYYLPRVEPTGLSFGQVVDWEELRPGRYGVLEPRSAGVRLLELDLVLVPGLAFDRGGRRLGRGGGHYDRLLAERRDDRPLCLGVAYEFQIVDQVPHGPEDQSVAAVVTEVAFHRRGAQ
jgi:5-formyltetrahydrofolate cyclo-ligase